MQIEQQTLQSIIAFIIVLSAGIFIIFKVVKKINHPVSACNGCSSECKGCELTELKKKIEKENKHKTGSRTGLQK